MKTRKNEDRTRWVSGDRFQFQTPKTPKLKESYRKTYHGAIPSWIHNKQQKSSQRSNIKRVATQTRSKANQKYLRFSLLEDRSERHLRSRILSKMLMSAEGEASSRKKREVRNDAEETTPKKVKVNEVITAKSKTTLESKDAKKSSPKASVKRGRPKKLIARTSQQLSGNKVKEESFSLKKIQGDASPKLKKAEMDLKDLRVSLLKGSESPLLIQKRKSPTSGKKATEVQRSSPKAKKRIRSSSPRSHTKSPKVTQKKLRNSGKISFTKAETSPSSGKKGQPKKSMAAEVTKVKKRKSSSLTPKRTSPRMKISPIHTSKSPLHEEKHGRHRNRTSAEISKVDKSITSSLTPKRASPGSRKQNAEQLENSPSYNKIELVDLSVSEEDMETDADLILKRGNKTHEREEIVLNGTDEVEATHSSFTSLKANSEKIFGGKVVDLKAEESAQSENDEADNEVKESSSSWSCNIL